MKSQKTIKNVFIVESLRFEDEENNHLEGKFLSHILGLHGTRSEYYYIRTRVELKAVLDKFDKSGFRYLHLSCHGNANSMATTLDSIPFQELEEILRPYLRNKRIFLSACSMANNELASTLMPGSGCLSIVGPSSDVLFSDAAIMWASFYHLMFKIDGPIKFKLVRPALKKLSVLYDVNLNYYSADSKDPKGYKFWRISPTGK